MDFTPTQEQQDIVDAMVNTNDNLIVNSLAGAAKTSTLVLLSKAMKENSALCLAFNKSIATEMAERLDSRCTAATLNALGHRTLAATLNKRLKLSNGKVYFLLKNYVAGLYDNASTKGMGFTDILKVIEYGKSHGFVPDSIPNTTSLLTEEELFEECDIILTAEQQRIVVDVSRMSYEQALSGLIDFNDQILVPTTLNDASFTRYPVVLIDEAQDLSNLNHEMLAQIVGDNRLIAVGDANQAIYAFRGAYVDSMDKLQERFNMRSLPLTITFRCAQAIVENAHWKTPDMKWRDGAPMGEVTEFKAWSVDDIPDDSAIICRNNAPLIKVFYQLLGSGVKAEIKNKDAVSPLIKIFNKFGSKRMERASVLEMINNWEAEITEKRCGITAHQDIQ